MDAKPHPLTGEGREREGKEKKEKWEKGE